jgi:elongation factor 1-beta
MADVIITLKIMPVAPDVDLKVVEANALEKILVFAGKTQTKTELEPVAFGLKAVNITFIADEAKGSPDSVVDNITALESVASCTITHVTRALG